MNCKTCKYWNMEHTQEGFNGCRIWNNYKHLGKSPEILGDGVVCEMCGHHNKTINMGEEGYEVKKQATFKHNLITHGPSELFEGWVRGMGIGLTNFSIITKEDDCCKYYKEK